MNSIPVFYSPKLVANAHSYSPSSGKPALVIESWQTLGIPIDIREPTPATEYALCLAHGKTYVQKVLACRADNGFRNRLPEVAASLPYTTGAFVSAAREALNNGKVAVAPVSGFHHACHDNGGEFCTFNGLVVAAQVLKKAGLVNKVGILDFDQHYGNGTVDIIRTRELDDWLLHYSAGAEYEREDQAEDFLKRIPELVNRFNDCDIIHYQAGADPHVADPLGGWLTTAQLAERDRLVFENAKSWHIPIAWNLAGGYQVDFRNVLNIHDNTLKACAKVYLTNVNE
ncbi:MAG: histone deacetylase [Methyloglobulus sp.]|nr:histone deacetylase [Methyloglobulus sp.]